MAGKKLSIKKLESQLQDLDDFDEPNIELEQYATPPHIAAVLLNTIDSSFDDIQDKLVADLGCGTGRLLVGCILSGARQAYGFDVDQDALNGALKNISDLFSDEEEPNDLATSAHQGCQKFNLIKADIASSDCDKFWEPWNKVFDTVVMNPPFGTKQNQGLDMLFLKRAVELSHGSVYSLHKTSTRKVSCKFNSITLCPPID